MNPLKLGLIGLINADADLDFWGSMQRVAGLGYHGVESPDHMLAGDAAANLKRLHGLGLEVIAIPALREALRDELERVIADAHALQTRNVACYWGPCESREQILRDAELYNRAGARLASEGLRLCYHNHEHEFKNSYDGVYALDLLAANTDPRHVFFEVDIAWVTFGGEDPARVLRRYAGRVPAIHVKDLWSLEKRNLFTAVGTGIVNIPAALQAARETGVEWAVVEQDQVRNLDAWQTVTASALNLIEQGWFG
jgi:sugar phosphate isomerase/epimerase